MTETHTSCPVADGRKNPVSSRFWNSIVCTRGSGLVEIQAIQGRRTLDRNGFDAMIPSDIHAQELSTMTHRLLRYICFSACLEDRRSRPYCF